jgi:flagellar hook assembly protein FlgD
MTIEYEVPQDSHVLIAIYSVEGERVRVLVDEQMPAGLHHVAWDGRDASGTGAAEGIYYCRMETGMLRDMRKILLLR